MGEKTISTTNDDDGSDKIDDGFGDGDANVALMYPMGCFDSSIFHMVAASNNNGKAQKAAALTTASVC